MTMAVRCRRPGRRSRRGGHPRISAAEVENREANAIQINDAYLDVAKSATDWQPAIQISVGDPNECGSSTNKNVYNPKFRFENFGWSNPKNAMVHYSFVNPNNKSTPSSFSETMTLGEMNKLTIVDNLFARLSLGQVAVSHQLVAPLKQLSIANIQTSEFFCSQLNGISENLTAGRAA
jgi:hypothetical protein